MYRSGFYRETKPIGETEAETERLILRDWLSGHMDLDHPGVNRAMAGAESRLIRLSHSSGCRQPCCGPLRWSRNQRERNCALPLPNRLLVCPRLRIRGQTRGCNSHPQILGYEPLASGTCPEFHCCWQAPGTRLASNLKLLPLSSSLPGGSLTPGSLMGATQKCPQRAGRCPGLPRNALQLIQSKGKWKCISSVASATFLVPSSPHAATGYHTGQDKFQTSPSGQRVLSGSTISEGPRGGGGALAACSCWLFSFPVPLPTLPVLPGIFSQIKDLPPTHRLKLCFLEKLNQCTCDISMRAAGVTWPPPPESPRSI